MIQKIMIIAIIGLLAGYVIMTLTQKQTEGFRGRQVDGELNLSELENPNPYHPASGELVLGTPDGRPYTAYKDLKPGSQDDVETDDDPRDLPWIASWSAADRFARQGHNCAVKYTKEGRDGTTIITTSKSCEAGMPHTRPGGRIIIPDSIPEPLRAEIIAHELVHIYQARQPEEWAKFYQRNWSFILHKEPPTGMPPSVIGARRSNPDTWNGGPWPCWMGRYWPVPVYTDPQAPALRNAITVWWDQWQNAVLKTPPTAWTDFFGSPSQDEHPHEIAAVMIVSQDTSTEAGRRLMNWWVTKGATLNASRGC